MRAPVVMTNVSAANAESRVVRSPVLFSHNMTLNDAQIDFNDTQFV